MSDSERLTILVCRVTLWAVFARFCFMCDQIILGQFCASFAIAHVFIAIRDKFRGEP